MSDGSSVSVDVPVYNSARILRELVRRLGHVLEGLTVTYELLVVNDGSHDASWQTIEELTRGL
jgi:polyisoprenyl-phosphate glycosyltransferase